MSVTLMKPAARFDFHLFEELPSVLQNKTMSFLETHDYKSFRKTSRRLYGPSDLKLRYIFAKKAFKTMAKPANKYLDRCGYVLGEDLICGWIGTNSCLKSCQVCAKVTSSCVCLLIAAPFALADGVVIAPLSYGVGFARGTVNDLSRLTCCQSGAPISLFHPNHMRRLPSEKMKGPQDQKMEEGKKEEEGHVSTQTNTFSPLSLEIPAMASERGIP